MRVLFLEIDTENEWAVASLGPAFLAAYLRRHGHEAALLRVPVDRPIAAIAEDILRAAPGLIGVSMTTRQWLRARDVLGGLRRIIDIPVIVGGLHPTFSPDEVLGHDGIDYLCLGEGETALHELIVALDSGRRVDDGSIANIWAKSGARPRLRDPIERLDALPFLARDLLDERWGVRHVTTQRGCPFPCTFCAARMYDALYASSDTTRYGRRRSHANVLAELAQLRAEGPLNYVIFLDDTFTIQHRWVIEFCKLYGAEFAVPFSLNARVETVNEPLLLALSAAGCRHIVYGVESGSERVRREIMKRNASNQRFRDVFRWTRQAGIMATANYIIGTPGETRAEMAETIALHHELEPADFGVFVFYPYPGTELFHLCRANGYLPEDYLTRPANHRESILSLPNVTQADIAAVYEEWTEIRVASSLRRVPTREPAVVAAAIRARAATG
ncbi:MAG TPA: radical SAM protein [Steroidobacteraceae bacterium]|nr:radical SAM protein [Steroidobacteraceae bacterium]